jgi:diguanylate cyclase (GGDEF)-like protein
VDIQQPDITKKEAGKPSGFPAESLDRSQAAVVVVGSQCRVLFANRAATRLLNHPSGFDLSGLRCHQLICGRELPCEDCLLQSDFGSQKSHTIRCRSGQDVYIREEWLSFPGFDLLLLFDVTREISALRNLDLTRKELKAKTILLERRRFVAAGEREKIQQVFDQLPDAFVQVDGQYQIVNKNKAVSRIMPEDSEGTCYSLLGKETPCRQCPVLEDGQLSEDRKVVHRVEGRCYTEHIVSSSDEGGGLLLFSDTTRQIELIEKIREQQETITRKNDILSKLVALQTRMQKAIVSVDMINYFLDMFLPVCHAEAALIIIDDIRPGCAWFVTHRGVDAVEAAPAVRSYLSREVQGMESRRIPDENLPWPQVCQLELIGGNGRKVGMIFFPKSESEEHAELIHLFSEPFGAFVHNRLLLRLLEEKANTDALTGLYNRRYVDGALDAEKNKQDNFGIPYSVIAVDANRLKLVNDQYGHDAGDRLLLFISDRLKAEVRTTDTVARTGGDEFLILLSDTPESGGRCLMQRLDREVFGDVSIEVGENERFPVTVSMGVAGSDQLAHEDILKMADERMYLAKEAYYRTQDRYR